MRHRAPLKPLVARVLVLLSGLFTFVYGCSVPHERAPMQSLATAGVFLEPQPSSREQYEHVAERGFVSTRAEPLSTFSIDVDTASYANVRRFLTLGTMPPKDAVRIEELINYFDYDYAEPLDAPVAVHTELGPCPWNAAHQLLLVGLKARSIPEARVPPRNLVFLIDVSGSMDSPDKLPLLKHALSRLTEQLREEDHISIVVYAGSEGLVLPTTSGDQHGAILDALDELSAGGSTNGGAGIELAYRMARSAFLPNGINRVILATDGDFNVGATSQGDLVRMVERQRESGVFLTVLGFGTGNLQDHTMESLADHGNGNYAYLDSEREAEKVLIREAGSTLVTMAKDVKVQLEMNPAAVSEYRLIGYENRALETQDFVDDRKDAGELGAGDSVTALYEIVPSGDVTAPPGLRYQTHRELKPRGEHSDEVATVLVRYQPPSGGESRLLEAPVRRDALDRAASSNFRLATAIAGFGMLLRDSPHKASASYPELRRLAASAQGTDPYGDRRELLTLFERAATLHPEPSDYVR